MNTVLPVDDPKSPFILSLGYYARGRAINKYLQYSSLTYEECHSFDSRYFLDSDSYF